MYLKYKGTITLHSLNIMESFDNRFTSQVDFNYCKDNIECDSASNAPILNFR